VLHVSIHPQKAEELLRMRLSILARTNWAVLQHGAASASWVGQSDRER